MFITRKELDKRIGIQTRLIEDVIEGKERELNSKIASLAKELGYEYVSEAVKEKDYSIAFPNVVTEWVVKKWEENLPDKAVLKWSWKKIKK